MLLASDEHETGNRGETGGGGSLETTNRACGRGDATGRLVGVQF